MANGCILIPPLGSSSDGIGIEEPHYAAQDRASLPFACTCLATHGGLGAPTPSARGTPLPGACARSAACAQCHPPRRRARCQPRARRCYLPRHGHSRRGRRWPHPTARRGRSGLGWGMGADEGEAELGFGLVENRQHAPSTVAVIETSVASCATSSHAAETRWAPLTRRVEKRAGSSCGHEGKRCTLPSADDACTSISLTGCASPTSSTPPPGAYARRLDELAP